MGNDAHQQEIHPAPQKDQLAKEQTETVNYMADEDEDERIYTIPLRKTINVSRTKRTPYAVRTIKRFVAKHMKSDISTIWIDPPVNEKLWSSGIESPPSKIRLRAKRVEEDLIEVTLPEE